MGSQVTVTVLAVIVGSSLVTVYALAVIVILCLVTVCALAVIVILCLVPVYALAVTVSKTSGGGPSRPFLLARVRAVSAQDFWVPAVAAEGA